MDSEEYMVHADFNKMLEEISCYDAVNRSEKEKKDLYTEAFNVTSVQNGYIITAGQKQYVYGTLDSIINDFVDNITSKPKGL